MTDAIYLDHNATTTVRPEASAAVVEALSTGGNASSVHRFGRLAKRILEDARDRVAALVSVKPAQVIFTSGGTEANNLALLGTGRTRVLTSAIEHASVLGAIENKVELAVEADGRVNPDVWANHFTDSDDSPLVSIMYANNETGVIQPVEKIAELAHANDMLVHCDAIQGAGKTPLKFADLGVDMLSLSSHKLGGPQGVGALVIRDDLQLTPLVRGGGQELRRRAGTENLPGIAGFGAAAEGALNSINAFQKLATLRDQLENKVKQRGPATVFGDEVGRLPNTSCLAMPGVNSETQIMGFDLAGIAVSAGSACSSGKVEPSHVLSAMGINDDLAGCAVRVSFGWDSQQSDVDRFVDAWAKIYNQAGGSASSTALAS
jgi:cysteine desulfurase